MKFAHALTGCILLLALTASTAPAGHKKEDAGPIVSVSKPVQRAVAAVADYTGITSSKDMVSIQPRVSGFLTKVSFKEGAEVKEGDVLYEIDPRPYQAQVEAARAKLAGAEATLKLAKIRNAHIKTLAKKGMASQEEADHAQAQEEQAVAALDLDKANLKTAMIRLDWTVIRAPIAGKIGGSELTVGNLVKEDATMLTNIVSTDPMYVHFNMDVRTLLTLRKSVKPGEEMKILMGLADEAGFPYSGKVDFVDGRVEANTGTIRCRAVVKNPKSKDGVALLIPGMFARVRVPLGQPREALLVTDRAIVTDMEKRFVWVIGAEDKAERREVKLGSLQDDGLRVIEDGLKQGDLVVVAGISRLRASLQVQPKEVGMPAGK